MNQPWLTTIDWPVRALVGNPAKKSTAADTSSIVVKSPSTVLFSITFRITCCSVMPNSRACAGIWRSANGVRTKPGHTTLARTLYSAPSFATTRASPSSPCFAVTYGAFSTDASFACTEPL